MTHAVKFPLVYQLNTRVWLHELSRKVHRTLTLEGVPDSEFQKWRDLHIDALWLMGVWQESNKGRLVAQTHPGLQQSYKRALPDFTEDDVVSSPYSVADYRVSDSLGGNAALQRFRQRLLDAGIKLILDFVPNHVALDHAWLQTHPEFFIAATDGAYHASPESFYEHSNQRFACGRDPYFPAWTDTLQLNYANPALHDAMIATLKTIATLCDGVRCDMSMLVLPEVFNRTWAHLGVVMTSDFWGKAIEQVKHSFPAFLFIAEAYWDTEWTLQQRGFDFIYDKRLYDRIAMRDVAGVKAHLAGGDLAFQQKLMRFTENHDEERAREKFGDNHKAAALLSLCALGARLIHEGQLEGWRVKLPVQLIRRPEEPTDADTARFYHKLIRVLQNSAVTCGDFRLLHNEGDQRIIAFERASGGKTGHIFLCCNLTDSTAESFFFTDAFESVESYEHLDIVSTEQFRSPQIEIWQSGVTVRLRPHEGIVCVLR